MKPRERRRDNTTSIAFIIEMTSKSVPNGLIVDTELASVVEENINL